MSEGAAAAGRGAARSEPAAMVAAGRRAAYDAPVPAAGATGRPLPRTAGWRAGVLVAAGAILPITVSIGPMAAALGPAMIVVWTATAVVGALQCVLLAELAGRFPWQAGGTATYAHVALAHRSPVLRCLSSWGYWFAWTPGIAVNLVLAADYLRAGLGLRVPTLFIAGVLGLSLYALGLFGLRGGLRLAALLAPLAAIPLLGLLVGGLLTPGAFHVARLHGLTSPAHPWSALSTWPLVVKWAFVAAWAAYGAELASTVVAELRSGADASRALGVSAVFGLAGFAVLPAVLVGLTGAGPLAADPVVALLPAAEAVYGPSGRLVLSLMLAAALVLGAQAFMIGSSRTVFQMARDGLLPGSLARVNRHGAPLGSIVLDAAVIGLLLAVFGTDVVSVVAAANIGYLAVFVVMPWSFLATRRRGLGARGGLRLGRAWDAIAVALLAFNTALLVAGALLWGARVALVGGAVLALAVPLGLRASRRA